MANIITELTARIEDYRSTNKNPCKNYATQAAATYFDKQNREDAPSADYVVFYVEAWGRWVGCINLSELLRRSNSTGGYLGFCKDFFTY